MIAKMRGGVPVQPIHAHQKQQIWRANYQCRCIVARCWLSVWNVLCLWPPWPFGVHRSNQCSTDLWWIPGWTTALMPASWAMATQSGNGKKASEAMTEPLTSKPNLRALSMAWWQASTLDVWPQPMPMSWPSLPIRWYWIWGVLRTGWQNTGPASGLRLEPFLSPPSRLQHRACTNHGLAVWRHWAVI